MCSFTAVIQHSINACCPTTQIHWVLRTRDSVSCLTRCLGEIREMIEIQSKVSVDIYLILNPKRVTSSHTALYMKHTGDAIVHAYAHKHMHTLSMTEHASENQAAAYGPLISVTGRVISLCKVP